MDASKHTIYLTKTHKLDGSLGEPTNVFMFNENGPKIPAKWARKNIEMNDGCFVVLDHQKAILKETERGLLKRNYYVENVDLSDMSNGIQINPFDLVRDTSEIHFLFLNFLYAMWDNSDHDITAMSNLIDAFASCVFFMFSNQKEKMNMNTLKKMVYSVRATCQTDDGVVSLSDAIFANIKDQESMPCKYYAQFKKAAGERQEEVAEKVAKVFDMFTESDMKMMTETDESLVDTFNFKTAVFVNVDKEEQEHSAKLMIILLNYYLQRVANHANILFILDNIDATRTLISLPHWMKESDEHGTSFIVISDDLAGFKANQRAEKFFRNLQKTVCASVLVHHNDVAIKFENELPTTNEDMDEFLDQEYIATVIIPKQDVNEQDELF